MFTKIDDILDEINFLHDLAIGPKIPPSIELHRLLIFRLVNAVKSMAYEPTPSQYTAIKHTENKIEAEEVDKIVEA